MSRSVTRLALAVGIPLVTMAMIGIVGPHSGSPIAAKPAAAHLALTFSSLRFGRIPALLDREPAPPVPTPMPTPMLVAVSRPAWATASAPMVHKSSPVLASVPQVRRPSASAVGGAAGVEFGLVNRDRSANGVASLYWSAALARVAQYRAQDMLNRNYFSHYDPSTGQLAFVELMHLWGIPYSVAGENIAWSTDPSMAGINTMFMNSPEHRANILDGAYHRVGIGVASNSAKTIVVEVFSN